MPEAEFLSDIWPQAVDISDPVSSVYLFLLCPVTNLGQYQMTVKSQITIVLKRVQNDTSYNKMTSYHQKYCLYNRGTFQTSDQEDEHKKSSHQVQSLWQGNAMWSAAALAKCSANGPYNTAQWPAPYNRSV